MSTSWRIGIITISPLNENQINKLVKMLFKKSKEVGFTGAWSEFSYNSLQKYPNPENFKLNFSKPPTITELSSLIKKFALKKGLIMFSFTADSESGGFDADFAITNYAEIIDINIGFEDYILKQSNNVEKLLEISKSVYNSVNAFYAYVSTEYDPPAVKGIENINKFKKAFKEYKKTGKILFDMTKFQEKTRKELNSTYGTRQKQTKQA